LTDVKVVNPDGQQAVLTGAFFALPGNLAAAAAALTITSVSPGFVPASGGAQVTITGTGFQPGLKVFFRGVPATVSGPPTATSVTVVSPALPGGPADVTVLD